MGKKAFKGHVPGKPDAPKRPQFPCGKARPQPVEPNAKVMAARTALGLTQGATVGPLAFAYAAGWISQREVLIADVYASAYRRAGLNSPSISTAKDQSVATGASSFLRVEWNELSDEEVRKLRWGIDFTAKEIVKIWDSAFRPPSGEGASPTAMRRWKAFAAAMTPAERDEVDRVVLHDLWPQWILDRRQEKPDPRTEAKRTLLIAGLRKIGGAIDDLRRRPANDHHINDN